MKESTPSTHPLTAYERAVCYYSLPRVTHPMTLGLVMAYLLCLFEALALFLYGLIGDHEKLTRWGIVLLVAIIVFGLVAFMIRAFLNDVRERKLLHMANRVPDVSGNIPSDSDLTEDPFEDHVLLYYALHHPGKTMDVFDINQQRCYTVAHNGRRQIAVSDPQGNELFSVNTRGVGGSFSLADQRASKAVVMKDEVEVANLQRRFSLSLSRFEIFVSDLSVPRFFVSGGSIYEDEHLIGRTYSIRGQLYLDIREDCLHDGILGYFIAMA